MPKILPNKIQAVGLAVLFAGAAGCGLFSTEPNGKSLPIEGRVLFKLAAPSSGQPSTQLTAITEKTYSCVNYTIKESTGKSGSLIQVMLREIFAPDICLTALGPARTTRSLDLADGSYTLQFTYRNKVDRYRVTLSGKSVKIETLVSTFTAPDSTIR